MLIPLSEAHGLLTFPFLHKDRSVIHPYISFGMYVNFVYSYLQHGFAEVLQCARQTLFYLLGYRSTTSWQTGSLPHGADSLAGEQVRCTQSV